ncbi:hypothetical protein ACP70R_014724 [Stipagrostis hirtigluma subsp. patula]
MFTLSLPWFSRSSTVPPAPPKTVSLRYLYICLCVCGEENVGAEVRIESERIRLSQTPAFAPLPPSRRGSGDCCPALTMAHPSIAVGQQVRVTCPGSNIPMPAPAPISPPLGGHASYPNQSPASSRSRSYLISNDHSGDSPTQPNGSSIQKQALTTGSPPRAAAATDAQIQLARDNAHFAYSAAVLMGIFSGLKDLADGWGTAPRVMYCSAMMLCTASVAIGIMAANSTTQKRSKLKLSAVCARFGTTLSSILLVVAISCIAGPLGWIVIVSYGVVVAAIVAVIWINGELAAAHSPLSSGVRSWSDGQKV